MTLQRKTPLNTAKAVETYQRRRRDRALAVVAAGGELPRMRQVSERRMEREGERIARAGSTIVEQGRGMAAAPAQQRKTRDAGGCRVLERLADVELSEWPQDVRDALTDWVGPTTVDSAHLACLHGCEDPDAIINIARPLHRAYDLHKLNLLPFLTREEETHAALEVGILGALKRITSADWRPVDGTSAGEDRLPMMSREAQADVVRQLGLVDALRTLTRVNWGMVA